MWYICARIYEEGNYQPSLLAEKSKITSTLKNEVTNHGSMQRWQVSLMLPHIKGSGFKPQAVWCWPSGCILSTEKIFRAHMLVITVVRWDWKVWQVATAGSMLSWCGKENIKAGHRRDDIDDASILSSAALTGNRKPIQSFVKQKWTTATASKRLFLITVQHQPRASLLKSPRKDCSNQIGKAK